MMSKRLDRALPAVGEGKRGEDGYLGYLLRQAAAAYRRRLDRALADLGVTPPQFAVMTMLKAYPGRSNADIARVALLTPQTTNVIIANLARAGLVQRSPHAVHGRVLQVALTAAGRALLRRCRARAVAVEEELVQGLPADETPVIRRWLIGVAQSNEVPSRSDVRRAARAAPGSPNPHA